LVQHDAMKLYLLRHATAAEAAASDAERPLTKEGLAEARCAGAALRALGVRLDRVLTSPLRRARETADLAAQAAGFAGEVVELAELENDAATADLLRALKPHREADALLLVGHMPSLAEHLAGLIAAGQPDGLALGKGAIACVELESLRAGAGRLRWFMRQAQLAKLAC